MPRVTPITAKSDVPAEHQAVADGVMKTFGRIRGPFSMLLHTPELAQRLLAIVNFFRESTVVEAPLRSLAALVAAREHEAAYVWAAQVEAARRAGVREDLIKLIGARGDAAGLPAEEREVVEYSRQLMRTNRVERGTFEALHKRHGTKWLVELTGALGYFGVVSGIVNAFEVPAPDGGDPLPR